MRRGFAMDLNWARRMAATMADSLGPTKGTPTVQRRVRNLAFPTEPKKEIHWDWSSAVKKELLMECWSAKLTESRKLMAAKRAIH